MAQSLFTTELPGLPNANDSQAYTLGTVIVVAVAGTVTHGRWLFPGTLPTGDVDFVLYDEVTEVELARATFVAPSNGNWNTVPLGSPQAVSAGQVLVAAIETPDRYVATVNFFNVDLVNGNLKGPDAVEAGGNGRLALAHATFPSTPSGNNACYFADLVFESSAAGAAERWRLTL